MPGKVSNLVAIRFLALALAASPVLCQAGAAVDPSPFGQADTGKWVLATEFSDEFNGPQLDQKKWQTDVPSWGQWTWDPANTYVQDGDLVLRMSYAPHERGGHKMAFRSGILKSRAEAGIRYGYFETRMRAAPLHPGVCPAFWAYRKTASQWTEIDFIELTSRMSKPTYLDFYYHVFKLPGFAALSTPYLRGNSVASTWDPRDAFHVYAAEWTPKSITWFVDGRKMQEGVNDHWHQSLDVVLSLGLRKPLKQRASAKGLPTEARVDYVRVWRRAADSQAGSEGADVTAP